MFGGERWKNNVLMTASFFTGIIFAVVIVINTVCSL